MGHRLTKIYTRTGDDRSTSLAANARLQKDDARVEATTARRNARGDALSQPLVRPAVCAGARAQSRSGDGSGVLAEAGLVAGNAYCLRHTQGGTA